MISGAGMKHMLVGGYSGVGIKSGHVSDALKAMKSVWHRGQAVLGVGVLCGCGLVCVV